MTQQVEVCRSGHVFDVRVEIEVVAYKPVRKAIPA
jgi:hypothetical protein